MVGLHVDLNEALEIADGTINDFDSEFILEKRKESFLKGLAIRKKLSFCVY